MNYPNSFSSLLYDWHSSVDRYLPWKEDKEVFYIWLSEIILQQTRVEQGIPYFLKFKDRFNDVSDLASATDEELMKLWEGLGYYSRARNMHKAAKQIMNNGGIFPNTYDSLLQLPGIGPYTAAAIASFAFNIPIPVIDGNVNRVISRIFGITAPIDGSEGKKQVLKGINSVFDVEEPAKFNQAIMDFGAMQCTPKRPGCTLCPFNEMCFAYLNNLVTLLPIKAKAKNRRERSLNYIILQHHDKILIRKRKDQDIWKHLYEFILIEEHPLTDESLQLAISDICKTQNTTFIKKSQDYVHLLTHQKLNVKFYHFKAKDLVLNNDSDYFLVDQENINNFAFPKIIDRYLKEKLIYLKEN